MTPRQHLNRFLEAVAIPHLALYLVVGQAIVFLLLRARPEVLEALPLVPALVLRGEWWRLFAFVAMPPSMDIFWNFMGWMMLYFVGNALDGHWGTVKYNLFVFTGWFLTCAAGFAFGAPFVVSFYFLLSAFLAFAFIAPDLEMMVFFVLPVKVKWLALAQWLWFAHDFVRGPAGIRFSVGAAVLTFLIFFWDDILLRVRGQGRRLTQVQRSRSEATDEPRHTCLICGKNNNTHPDLDFRYCSKCADEKCYCPDHIRNHEHVLADKGRPGASK